MPGDAFLDVVSLVSLAVCSSDGDHDIIVLDRNRKGLSGERPADTSSLVGICLFSEDGSRG
jgi:hypothetical protein